MRQSTSFIIPSLLVAIGFICISGFDLFGSALLEGAAWKQNVIYGIFIIFCMLPPMVLELKATWMVAGYALAFFMFGGANIIGTVGIVLGIIKICLIALTLFQGYRLYVSCWDKSRWQIVIPALALIGFIMLLPIQDENIVGSSFRALTEGSWDRISSDKGFHIYLGLATILSGITEFVILKNTDKPKSPDESKV